MSRSHNHIVLLAVLAMLTFALTNLQAQIAATNAATIPSTSTRPITDAQFKKILADAQANGKDRLTSSEVTTAFGITHKGETLTLRQDSFWDENVNYVKHTVKHTFVNTGNGNYVFAKATKQDVYDYYVDKNLMLISALIISNEGEITIIPNKDAQAGLDAELKFFAGIADQL